MIEDILTPKQRTLQAFRNIFDTAFELTVNSYIELLPVVVLAAREIRELRTESLMTPDGLDAAGGIVFEDVNIREFMATLQVNFYSLCGEYHSQYLELADAFAWGLTTNHFSQDTEASNYELVPKEIVDRVYSKTDAVKYLLVNKWLMVFVMFKYWARLPTEQEIQAAMRSQLRSQAAPAQPTSKE